MPNPFKRDPAQDPPACHKRFADPDRGLHTFFRHTTTRMQARFCELLERSGEDAARAFLHGNPHLDNYAKSRRGAAMVDFDRSRLGPCAYDVVRFLISVSLRSAEQKRRLLSEPVLESFRRGYAHGVLSRALGYEEMLHLRGLPPKRWQESTRAYVRSRRRWAAKLEAFAVDPGKKRMRALLRRYLLSRDELYLLERYRVHRAAKVPGSQGKLHHVYWLRPLESDDAEEARDDLLLDVKEVYDEPDDPWFSNPFDHNGLRMIAAGALYAPGWDQRPGWVTYKGREYWCRQVPLQNAKLKRPLGEVEQIEVCYAVGSQLGRGHALSASLEPLDLHELFNEQFGWYTELAVKLRAEVAKAHRSYVNALPAAASA